MTSYSALPVHIREPMRAFIERGVPPGRFLRAVLENDFIKAATRADDVCAAALPAIARFLTCEAPDACHGSPAAVSAWIATARAPASFPLAAE